MASYIPPTADLSTFNPAIFNQGDSEGITLQEADSRYLKKSGGFLTGGLGTPSISLDGTDLATTLETQEAAIALNTAKTGITTDQANAIEANTAKVGITQTQADEITSFRTTLLSTGQIEIATNSAPQLLVNRTSGGGDGIMKVRGARTSSGHETAQLYFENSNSITGNIGIFGTIVGEKTSGNNGDLGDLVFKTTSAVNSGVYTNAEAMRLKRDNTIEISASSTTLKSLLSNDAAVDTSIHNKLTLVHTSANGYTAFDGNIFLGRSSIYRPYYMGLLGDETTNSNVFCIAGVGGSGDNPDPVFAINENGNGEFAARCTAPLFVDGGANDLRTDIDSKQPALTAGDGITIDSSNTISFDPSQTTTLKTLRSEEATVDTTIDNKLGILYTTANGYTAFDQNIELGRTDGNTGDYRDFYIGLLGNNSSGKTNVFCIAGHGGGAPDPNAVFAIDQSGNAEFAGNCTVGGSLKYTDASNVVKDVETELNTKQNTLTIDDAVDESSTNPVENQAVHLAISNLHQTVGSALGTKQDSLTAGNNITISNEDDGSGGSVLTIASTDTNTTYSAASNGGLSLSGTSFSLASTIDTGDSATIKAGNMFYYAEDEAGVMQEVNIEDKIEANDASIALKQAILTDANNGGTNITIDSDGVISSTDTNTTYSAASNGGLSLSGTSFSLASAIDTGESATIKAGSMFYYAEDESGATQAVNIKDKIEANEASIALKQAALTSAEGISITTTQSPLVNSIKFDGSSLSSPITVANTIKGNTLKYVNAAGNEKNVDTEITSLNASIVTKQDTRRIAYFNYNESSVSNNIWGVNNYLNGVHSGRRIGTSFCTQSQGRINILYQQGGTLKITVTATCENKGRNERLVVGTYVSINNNSANWRNSARLNGRWGVSYIKDNNHGVAATHHYCDYYQLDGQDSIRIKTKLGEGNDNRNYNDQEPNTNLNLWVRVEVERISGSDLVVTL